MVFRLAMLVCRPTSIERLKAQAIEQKANSIAWMFGSTHIDHEGMTLARIPAGLGIDDANGAVIWPIMMTRMRIDHELAVAGQIIPATDEITMKYPISRRFFAICSSIIPSSRLGMKSFSSRVWFAVSMEIL